MKLSLSVKILSTVLTVVIFLLAMGIISFWGTGKMTEAGDQATKNLRNALLAKDAAYLALKTYKSQAKMMVDKNTSYLKDFDNGTRAFTDVAQRLAEATETPEEQSWVSSMKDANTKYADVVNGLLVPALNADAASGVSQIAAFSDALTDTVAMNVDNLMRAMERRAEESALSYRSTASRSRVMILIFGLFSTVLGIGLGFLLAKSIARPINRMVYELKEGAEHVGAASVQVASSSQSLAEGASQQASALEETASSLEQMASMTRQNAENARQANILAAQASTSADQGMSAMERVAKAISGIKVSSDETAKIIKVIDEIAFQTNLLALNAAVEAARAGEAGKGFAVVAEEVRNLAQRSAEAAKNTSSLIEQSQRSADDGVKSTQEFMAVLNEITTSIKKVKDLISEVSVASEEQSQGIHQANASVAQMDEVTQQTASSAEESSSASEQLAAQAHQMKMIVNRLNQIISGQEIVQENREPHEGVEADN